MTNFEALKARLEGVDTPQDQITIQALVQALLDARIAEINTDLKATKLVDVRHTSSSDPETEGSFDLKFVQKYPHHDVLKFPERATLTRNKKGRPVLAGRSKVVKDGDFTTVTVKESIAHAQSPKLLLSAEHYKTQAVPLSKRTRSAEKLPLFASRAKEILAQHQAATAETQETEKAQLDTSRANPIELTSKLIELRTNLQTFPVAVFEQRTDGAEVFAQLQQLGEAEDREVILISYDSGDKKTITPLRNIEYMAEVLSHLQKGSMVVFSDKRSGDTPVADSPIGIASNRQALLSTVSELARRAKGSPSLLAPVIISSETVGGNDALRSQAFIAPTQIVEPAEVA